MEIITDIRRERKQVLIVLSNRETIRIPAVLLRERPLSVNQEIDLEEYDKWLLLKQYRYALDRAVGYLAARACSKKQIQDKLARVGYRPATIEMVLYKLERENLLDDADFARQWVESRMHRSLGRSRIAQQLRRKGITGQDADDALDVIDDEDQLEGAVLLARKGLQKVKPDEDIRKAHARVSAMLARRGYSWEIIRSAMEKAGAEIDDDDE